MNKRRILFTIGILLSLFVALFLITCAKDEGPQSSSTDQMIDLRDGSGEIPEEVAQWLTEDEIAAFWASKPSHNPANPQNGKTGKRPKKWRPFFVWGPTLGATYPVFDCKNYEDADICWKHEDCPDKPLDPPHPRPLLNYVTGDAHMSGYGKITQEWKRFVCPPAVLNGTYVKDEHRLQWRPFSSPNCTYKDGYYLTTFTMKVCNASLPLDEQCWTPSTGDFEDSEGVFNYRIITEWNFCNLPNTPGPSNPPSQFFEVGGPAYRIAWGWLYY